MLARETWDQRRGQPGQAGKRPEEEGDDRDPTEIVQFDPRGFLEGLTVDPGPIEDRPGPVVAEIGEVVDVGDRRGDRPEQLADLVAPVELGPRADDLTAPDYVVLGMVWLGARSGYEIKQTVERSIRFFWTISQAQIYPTRQQIAMLRATRPAAEALRTEAGPHPLLTLRIGIALHEATIRVCEEFEAAASL